MSTYFNYLIIYAHNYVIAYRQANLHIFIWLVRKTWETIEKYDVNRLRNLHKTEIFVKALFRDSRILGNY